MGIYVDEFLYRGRSDTTKSAWHVVLASEDVDPFGQIVVHLSAPMTPVQASEQGFPLEKILADINTQLLDDLNKAREQIAEHVTVVEDLTSKIQELKSVNKDG